MKAEPDVARVVSVGGVWLQPEPECKSRKRLPRLLVDALAQARRYSPGAEPLAVLREVGGCTLVVVELATFCRLVEIDPSALPTKGNATPRPPRQLELSL